MYDLALLLGFPVSVFIVAYLVGSVPFAYIIVKAVTGEDVTQHGSGNVGAMNVRRSTGSWGWFVVAMVADAMKGLIPVALAKGYALDWNLDTLLTPMGPAVAAIEPPVSTSILIFVQCALAGAVLGHNYSVWMALIKRRFHRTGKGLATGGGALLAYDWRYFVVVVAIGLLTIAITRYMMAGQVSAAASLPVAALMLGSPDWPFALFMAIVVIAAHWKRFVGMLAGREPMLYINDRMGPRG